MVIPIPLFRKASSLRRWDNVSKLNVTVSKISSSGRKITSVPVISVSPTIVIGPSGTPL